MPGEKPPKPLLTIGGVARLAKETTLRDGYHLPTVIADGDRKGIVMVIEPIASTHDGRAQQLFMLGAILAEQSELGALQQVFLITEAWMSVATRKNPPHFPPSQDPQRKEILAVSRRSIHIPKTDMVVFEMKRNRRGKLVRLDNLDSQIASQNEGSAESPLLEAFVIGYLGTTHKPND